MQNQPAAMQNQLGAMQNQPLHLRLSQAAAVTNHTTLTYEASSMRGCVVVLPLYCKQNHCQNIRLALNIISSPPPTQQPLFQALISQSQQGPLNPDLASPDMEQAGLFGPTPAGPRFADVVELDYSFMDRTAWSPQATSCPMTYSRRQTNVEAWWML